MEKSILSVDGRIRRKTYWTRVLIAAVISYGVSFAATQAASPALGIVSLVVSLVVGVFMIIQGIKRMHDVDKSGWFILIPLYNLILCLTAGTTGSNQYGEDPKGIN